MHHYAFIDGNYLRRAYEDTMRRFFSDVDHRDIDFAMLKRSVGASKAFFYDSIDDDAADADARETYLDQIRSIQGFHVREGTVSKDRKRRRPTDAQAATDDTTRKDRDRQKQVDVYLAVECLTHAFNQNALDVTLLTGDLDFKPLVDALINLGAHVQVYYEPRSGSRRLYRAADVAVPIDLRRFWDWSLPAFQRSHPLPRVNGNAPHTGEIALQHGEWQGRSVTLWQDVTHGEFTIYVDQHGDHMSEETRFDDRTRLTQYFELTRGEIRWTG